VKLWQANNPLHRDFRLDTLGPVWRATELPDQGNGVFVGTVGKPAQGWTAYFVELTYDLGARTPLKLTTDVRVTPDTLPFSAPTPTRPTGFLSR
jgi:PhoPQ-activated pathogenicity-related protein